MKTTICSICKKTKLIKSMSFGELFSSKNIDYPIGYKGRMICKKCYLKTDLYKKRQKKMDKEIKESHKAYKKWIKEVIK